jgi:carboxylesterase type B
LQFENTNISYQSTTVENNNNTPKLNIFVPRKSKAEQSQVLIFVHGGNWNSGRKELMIYWAAILPEKA